MIKIHASHTQITIKAMEIDEIFKVHGCGIKSDSPRGEKNTMGNFTSIIR